MYKILFSLVAVAFVLTAAGAAWVGYHGTTPSCCEPGAACCYDGSPCCSAPASSCCEPGAACCYDGSPCCGDSCCSAGASCCEPSAACCGAKK